MEIVFIHLNTRVPRYLYWNLKTHINRFPEHSVRLIHSNHIKPPKIKGLYTSFAIEDPRWGELNQLYNHPKEFRANFWLTSSVRLFALENHMSKLKREMIHVESDVILAPDFPFDSFTRLDEKLAFPLISNERGVASIVYLRNLEAARILTSTLLSEASIDKLTTEMLSLRKVYERNRKKVHVLPIGGSTQDFRNIDSKSKENITKSCLYFGGIFDGVEIGQFFFGTDPRNRRGKKLLRTDLVNGYVNVVNLFLRYEPNRRFINVVSKASNTSIKLYTVHIPSKETELFRTRSQSKVLEKGCDDSKLGPRSKVLVRPLFLAIVQSILRRVSKVKQK